MKIKVLSSGHRPPLWLQQGVSVYQQRLVRYCTFELHHLHVTHVSLGTKKISRHLQQHIGVHDRVIALDETGKKLTSLQWGKQFLAWQQEKGTWVFLIGTAEGLLPIQREYARHIWSLSDLTFPHHMVQLILVEQIYRAVCFCQGHPYPR